MSADTIGLVTPEIVAVLADLDLSSVCTGSYLRRNGGDLTDDEMKLIGEASIEDMAEALRMQAETRPVSLADLTDDGLEVLAAMVKWEQERRSNT